MDSPWGERIEVLSKVEKAEQNGNEMEIAQALYELGLLNYREHRRDEMLENFHKLLPLARKHLKEEDLANILKKTAEQEFQHKNIDYAVECLTESSQLYEKLGNTEESEECKNAIAYVTSYISDEIINYMGVARVANNKEQYKKAHEAITKSLHLQKKYDIDEYVQNSEKLEKEILKNFKPE